MLVHFFQLFNIVLLALWLYPEKSKADRALCLPDGPSSQGFTARFFPYQIGSLVATNNPLWLEQDYMNNDPIGQTSGILDPNYYIKPCVFGTQRTCPLSSPFTADAYGRLKCGNSYCLNNQNGALSNLDMFGFSTTPTNITVELSGYLYTSQTGNYVFSLNNIDDAAIIVVGADVAFPCCGQAAQDLLYDYNSDVTCLKGGNSPPPNCQTTISLTAGNYYPVRIVYANIMSLGRLGTSLTLPDGTVINNWGTQVYSYLNITNVFSPVCEGGYTPPSSIPPTTSSTTSLSSVQSVSTLSSLFPSTQSIKSSSVSSVSLISKTVFTLSPSSSVSSVPSVLSTVLTSSLSKSRSSESSSSSSKSQITVSLNTSSLSKPQNGTSFYSSTQENPNNTTFTVSKLVSRAINASSIYSITVGGTNNTQYSTYLSSNNASQPTTIVSKSNNINISSPNESMNNTFTSVSPESRQYNNSASGSKPSMVTDSNGSSYYMSGSNYNNSASGSNTMMSGGSRSVVTLSPSDMMSGSVMTDSNGSSYYMSGSNYNNSASGSKTSMNSMFTSVSPESRQYNNSASGSKPSMVTDSNGSSYYMSGTNSNYNVSSATGSSMSGYNSQTGSKPSMVTDSNGSSFFMNATEVGSNTDHSMFTSMSPEVRTYNSSGSVYTVVVGRSSLLSNGVSDNNDIVSISASVLSYESNNFSSYSGRSLTTMNLVSNSYTSGAANALSVPTSNTNDPNVTVYTVTTVEGSVILSISDVIFTTSVPVSKVIELSSSDDSVALSTTSDGQFSPMVSNSLSSSNMVINSSAGSAENENTASSITVMTSGDDSQIFMSSISGLSTNTMDFYNSKTISTQPVLYSNSSSTRVPMDPSNTIFTSTGSNIQNSEMSGTPAVSTTMVPPVSYIDSTSSISLTSPVSTGLYDGTYGFKSMSTLSVDITTEGMSEATSSVFTSNSVEAISTTPTSDTDVISYSEETITSYYSASITEQTTILSIVTETETEIRKSNPISLTMSLSTSSALVGETQETQNVISSSYMANKSYSVSISSPQGTSIANEVHTQHLLNDISSTSIDDTPSTISTYKPSTSIVSEETQTMDSKITEVTTQPNSMNIDDNQRATTRTSVKNIDDGDYSSGFKRSSEVTSRSVRSSGYLDTGSTATNSMSSNEGYNEVQVPTDSAIDNNSFDSKSIYNSGYSDSTVSGQSKITSKTQALVTTDTPTSISKSNSIVEMQTSSGSNTEYASVTTYHGSASSININHMLATIFIFIGILI